MIHYEVYNGSVSSGVSCLGRHILLQTNSGEGENYVQSRIALTVKETEDLIFRLQKNVKKIKEDENERN